MGHRRDAAASVVGRDGKAFQLDNKVLMAAGDAGTTIAPVGRQTKEVVAADIIGQLYFADA